MARRKINFDYRVNLGCVTGMLSDDEECIVCTDSDDDDEECIICNNEFVDGDGGGSDSHEQVYILPCNHAMYGKECLLRWLYHENGGPDKTCSYCNQIVMSVRTVNGDVEIYKRGDTGLFYIIDEIKDLMQCYKEATDTVVQARNVDRSVCLERFKVELSQLQWLFNTSLDRRDSGRPLFEEMLQRELEGIVVRSNELLTHVLEDVRNAMTGTVEFVQRFPWTETMELVQRFDFAKDLMVSVWQLSLRPSRGQLDDIWENLCMQCLAEAKEQTDGTTTEEARYPKRLDEIYLLENILKYNLRLGNRRNIMHRFESLIVEHLAECRLATENTKETLEHLKKGNVELLLLNKALRKGLSSEITRNIELRCYDLLENIGQIQDKIQNMTDETDKIDSHVVQINACEYEMKILKINCKSYCECTKQILMILRNKYKHDDKLCISILKNARARILKNVSRVCTLVTKQIKLADHHPEKNENDVLFEATNNLWDVHFKISNVYDVMESPIYEMFNRSRYLYKFRKITKRVYEMICQLNTRTRAYRWGDY